MEAWLREIIEKQNELIAELINENAEKENTIKVLTSEFNDIKSKPYEYIFMDLEKVYSHK